MMHPLVYRGWDICQNKPYVWSGIRNSKNAYGSCSETTLDALIGTIDAWENKGDGMITLNISNDFILRFKVQGSLGRSAVLRVTETGDGDVKISGDDSKDGWSCFAPLKG